MRKFVVIIHTVDGHRSHIREIEAKDNHQKRAKSRRIAAALGGSVHKIMEAVTPR